jgi:hypothetical protein
MALGDPLPEASELTIQLQRKATQERAVRGTDGRDWTQYVIVAHGLSTRGDASPAGLDQRRAALGLAPEAENRARLLAPPSS